jgi:hypothetical protein
METLTSWNPLGHSRPVTGLLYLYLYQSIHEALNDVPLQFNRQTVDKFKQLLYSAFLYSDYDRPPYEPNLCHFNPLHTPTYHFCYHQLIMYSSIHIPIILHEGKFHPRTGYEGPEEEWRCSYTLFFNLGSGWGGWSTPCLSGLTLGKETGTYCTGGSVGPRVSLGG